MTTNPKGTRKLRPIWRVLVEVGFIIFLFYSNLLMGEFARGNGRGKSLAFAIRDEFTAANFAIAVVCGLIGYVFFEFLRKRV
jgi:Na+/melibiose symporter-like transporter